MSDDDDKETRTFIAAQPGYRWINLDTRSVQDVEAWQRDCKQYGVQYVSDPIIGWCVEFVTERHKYGGNGHPATPVVSDLAGSLCRGDEALGGIICPHGFVETYDEKFRNIEGYFDELFKRAAENDARRKSTEKAET